MPDDKKDFFISYAAADEQWAEWVASVLEETGYTTIIQVWDFKAGGEFPQDIHNAIISCNRTISILTPSYLLSGWCLKEALTVLSFDITDRESKLIPVRVMECNPEGLLKTRTNINLIDLEEN